MTPLTPFHIAVQVRDLEEARRFYKECARLFRRPQQRPTGSTSISLATSSSVHLNEALGKDGKISQIHNAVDGHGVPVPHCGVVLTMDAFDALAQRIAQRAKSS